MGTWNRQCRLATPVLAVSYQHVVYSPRKGIDRRHLSTRRTTARCVLCQRTAKLTQFPVYAAVWTFSQLQHVLLKLDPHSHRFQIFFLSVVPWFVRHCQSPRMRVDLHCSSEPGETGVAVSIVPPDGNCARWNWCGLPSSSHFPAFPLCQTVWY